MPSQRPVRVRFAPSPTGYLHIGGLRTALYNYLFARRLGGAFVLRIEDTDRTRFVADAEVDITTSLSWAGLTWDEGPGLGGDFGPYRQSERRAVYASHARSLIESGNAYLAFDTAEALDALRETVGPDGQPARYDATTRLSMRNSLALNQDETRALIDAGTPHVIRLKVVPGEVVSFEDQVRGVVSFATDTIDDQVLVKSDGMPTYHLANVVDDHLMEISHVIRGEEWLPSTPKHSLLYRAFGWEMPVMAHLPLIMSPTGGKLSKRSADRLGIPINVRDYVSGPYEPAAVINYLAMLGWNPGDEREVFTLEGLTDAFSLERVGSAGVQFDTDKLAWFNQQHLHALSPEQLADRAATAVQAAGIETDRETLVRVCALMRERLSFASDLAEARYFFDDPVTFDPAGVSKRWKPDAAELVRAYADALDLAPVFDTESVEVVLRDLTTSREVGAGRLIHPVRLAVSGVTQGPGLFELLDLLGRETCVRRLRHAVELLG